MKLVFAHDHLFQKSSDGKLFTGGSFNNRAWKRYLAHFDEIVVLARVEELKDKYNNKVYNPFDLKETKLQVVPSIGGPLKKVMNKQEARKIIKKTLIESDALIARLPSETGNLAIEIAKELNKPYAVEVVACAWDALWNHGKVTGKIYAPLALNNMRNNVKNSKYTLYVTNEFLQKRYPSKGKTTNVSNVEIDEVFDAAYKQRQKRINDGIEEFRIGMIGSLKNNIKGWDVALRALKILKDKQINFKFYILGDGDIDKWKQLALELKISENVIFTGVLPGGKPVLEWMDKLDLYIQPSFQEGLPRAVIEAMSRGCPVAGSNAGGIPELINKECVHKSGDYSNLSKIIMKITSEKKFMINLVDENLKTAKQYEKTLLDKKRNTFWSEFTNEVSD